MPQEFQDSVGRRWTIALTGGSVSRISQELGADLSNLMPGPKSALAIITYEESALTRLLWALCRKQAEQLGVDQENFGEAMGPDALTAAEEGFFKELDFFYRKRKRPQMAEAYAKARQVAAAEIEATADRLTKQLGDLSGAIAANSPQSLDATPSPERSAS